MEFNDFGCNCRVHVLQHPTSNAAQTSAVALCVAFVTAVAFVWLLRSHRSEPPSLADADAWQWVSTAPGFNIYMHELSGQHSPNTVTAWVAVRFASSAVSVKADLLELREFDCRQFLSRRVAGPFHGSAASEMPGGFEGARASPWGRDDPESVPGKVFARICTTAG